MGVPLLLEKRAEAFHEQGAVEALLEMLGMFRSDEVFLRQTVETLIPLCEQDGERFCFTRLLASLGIVSRIMSRSNSQLTYHRYNICIVFI